MTGVATEPAAGTRRRSKIRTLKLATIYSDRGIEVETFDNTIETMNAIRAKSSTEASSDGVECGNGETACFAVVLHLSW